MFLRRSFKGGHKLVAFLLIVTLSFVTCDSEVPRSCVGPTGRDGFCIPLINCTSLSDILNDDPPVAARIRFLQHATCKIDIEMPSVCCPAEEVPKVQQPTPTPPQIDREFDPKYVQEAMELHPNRNLLPRPGVCGQAAPGSQSILRIIGGTKADLGAYPWMALLSFIGPDSDSAQLACGAALINSLYVLTASHCVSNIPGGFKVTKVRLGEFDEDHNPDCSNGICAPPFQEIEVDEIVHHDDYNKTGLMENDIALVRLKEAVTIAGFIQPICIPQGKVLERNPEKEGYATVAGWGRTRWWQEAGSPILQKVSVPIVPQERCAKQLFRTAKLHPSQLCAGGEHGKDSCKGDSGGPMFKTVYDEGSAKGSSVYQLGIVSVGASKCGSKVPAVYTKVSHFVLWILDHIRP